MHTIEKKMERRDYLIISNALLKKRKLNEAFYVAINSVLTRIRQRTQVAVFKKP